MTEMWTARSLRSISLRLDLICSFCSIFLPVVTATCCLVSSLFGSKYMSAWINANLNCCGCKEVTGFSHSNERKQQEMPEWIQNGEFDCFFLSPLWYFRRVKAPKAKQREDQRSLRSHHVMHTRKQYVHTQRSVYKHTSSLVSWFSAGVSGWFPSLQLIVCLAKAAISDFFCENAPWDRQSLAVCYHVSSPQPPPQSELRLVLC